MFKWRDEFSVNINSIDTQHKKLFEIGSRLYDLLSLKENYDHYDEILTILGELYEYTEYHFSYEEKLLEESNYDKWDLKIHKAEHKGFLSNISKYTDKQIDDNQQKVSLELLQFIANWIEKHVLETDKQYISFLK